MEFEIFSERSTDEIKDAIKKWLKEHPNINIKFITQSESKILGSGFNITVSIFYEEKE